MPLPRYRGGKLPRHVPDTVVRYRDGRGRWTTPGRAHRVEISKRGVGIVGYETRTKGHYKAGEARAIAARLEREEKNREIERYHQQKVRLTLGEEVALEELNLMHLLGTGAIDVDSDGDIVKVSIHTTDTDKDITTEIVGSTTRNWHTVTRKELHKVH